MMIGRQLTRNLLLVLLGATMWLCAMMVSWMWEESVMERYQGAPFILPCVHMPPYPEAVAIILLFAFALLLNRRVLVDCPLNFISALGLVLASVVVGTIIGFAL